MSFCHLYRWIVDNPDRHDLATSVNRFLRCCVLRFLPPKTSLPRRLRCETGFSTTQAVGTQTGHLTRSHERPPTLESEPVNVVVSLRPPMLFLARRQVLSAPRACRRLRCALEPQRPINKPSSFLSHLGTFFQLFSRAPRPDRGPSASPCITAWRMWRSSSDYWPRRASLAC
ncbi:hypothetical protein LZ30DRAFT_124547 [Colletotrichum cereale]|nr:hypothetical protein LZ30DRAFT_124547 [Colletotrichum cereale]